MNVVNCKLLIMFSISKTSRKTNKSVCLEFLSREQCQQNMLLLRTFKDFSGKSLWPLCDREGTSSSHHFLAFKTRTSFYPCLLIHLICYGSMLQMSLCFSAPSPQPLAAAGLLCLFSVASDLLVFWKAPRPVSFLAAQIPFSPNIQCSFSTN